MTGLVSATQLFLSHYGLAALFILLVIEEAGVWLPLPGDLVIMYFGAQIARSPSPLLAAIPVLLTITVAVFCGSLLLYLLTRRFSWVLRRFGPVIRLDEQRLTWMDAWLRRHGAVVIIPGRLVPGLRIPTTVVSGAFGVPLPLFLAAVSLAALVWGAMYLALGAAGLNVLELVHGLLPDAPLEWLLFLLGVLGLAGLVFQSWRLLIRARSR